MIFNDCNSRNFASVYLFCVFNFGFFLSFFFALVSSKELYERRQQNPICRFIWRIWKRFNHNVVLISHIKSHAPELLCCAVDGDVDDDTMMFVDK